MGTSTESESIKAAKKNHSCSWCGQQIEAGQPYEKWRWFDGGDASVVKVHPECYLAAKKHNTLMIENEAYAEDRVLDPEKYAPKPPTAQEKERRKKLNIMLTTAACVYGDSGPRDYPEDGPENMYHCRCTRCEIEFLGYKGRLHCKVCADSHARLLAAMTTEELKEYNAQRQLEFIKAAKKARKEYEADKKAKVPYTL